MSSSKYQCCICGCLIKVKKDYSASKNLVCPECGETKRIRLIETGLRRFLHGGSGIKQPLEAIICPANGISRAQYSSKAGQMGCSRTPACCGRATACDAPPCINGICVVNLQPRTTRNTSRIH